MWRASREGSVSGPVIRAWTYVLMSSALLLRKAEAADLQLGDIEVPLDKVSGQTLIVGGYPNFFLYTSDILKQIKMVKISKLMSMQLTLNRQKKLHFSM